MRQRPRDAGGKVDRASPHLDAAHRFGVGRREESSFEVDLARNEGPRAEALAQERDRFVQCPRGNDGGRDLVEEARERLMAAAQQRDPFRAVGGKPLQRAEAHEPRTPHLVEEDVARGEAHVHEADARQLGDRRHDRREDGDGLTRAQGALGDDARQGGPAESLHDEAAPAVVERRHVEEPGQRARGIRRHRLELAGDRLPGHVGVVDPQHDEARRRPGARASPTGRGLRDRVATDVVAAREADGGPAASAARYTSARSPEAIRRRSR